MIDHRPVIFVLAVVKVAKRDVTAVRSLVRIVSKYGTPKLIRTGFKSDSNPCKPLIYDILREN